MVNTAKNLNPPQPMDEVQSLFHQTKQILGSEDSARRLFESIFAKLRSETATDAEIALAVKTARTFAARPSQALAKIDRVNARNSKDREEISQAITKYGIPVPA